MVYHKRTQSRWAAKASVGMNNTHDREFVKPGIRRTYSEDTNLSETGKWSSSSSASGDESWSELSSPEASPVAGRKTKLSGEAELFVPQQSTQGPGEQRTRLSSGASVFVPGQMASQQVAPAFSAPMGQMPQAPVNGAVMLMPQMAPMDQANVMQFMAPCYMAPDGCYYVAAADGVCPVTMPVILGGIPQPAPFGMPEASTEAIQEPERPMQLEKPSTMKDAPCIGNQKTAANTSGKSRWADLDDDDDLDNPWLQ